MKGLKGKNIIGGKSRAQIAIARFYCFPLPVYNQLNIKNKNASCLVGTMFHIKKVHTKMHQMHKFQGRNFQSTKTMRTKKYLQNTKHTTVSSSLHKL